jgi:hypothetical protein
MAIFKIEDNKFVELDRTSFEAEKIYEVRDMQKFLSYSINIIDNELLVIDTEFSDWEDSRRSIDILCVDSDANLVVMELKRTKDGGHMELQAIRYAAMIANMKFEKAVKTYSKYLKKIGSDKDAEEELLNFFEWDERLEDDFAQEVKIVLVSADFSKELTTSILWLNEKQGIDIRCVRVKPQKDGSKLYFDIQQIIPLPETKEYQVKLKEKAVEERTIRLENKRAKSIIKQLFELNRLKIGDKVILKPAIEQGHSRELATAKIVNTRQNCLERNGEDKLYSFSKLRKILTKELELEDVKANWGFTIKHDWTTEEGKELIELLNE